MMISLLVKCAKCVFPAFVASAAVTPSSTVADIAVVQSASSGGMMSSIVDATKHYSFDVRSALTFMCTFSTLLATNCFVDKRVNTLSGVVVHTGFSMCKDSAMMGGGLCKTSRVLFVFRDVTSIYASISCPKMCFLHKACVVVLCQIPSTLLNCLAMDVHIFGTPRRRSRRVFRSFCANFPIRLLKSTFGSTLACEINHGMVSHF